MPRLRDEFKRYVRSHRPAAHCDNSAAKGGTQLMKIRISRTAGAVALASALVASGLVLAAAPKKPAATPRGQAAELASMCRFCEANKSICSGSGSGGATKELALAPDAGMSTETCTYPPCSTTSARMVGSLAELKLACAGCRAICPKASGAPAVQTTPDQQK